MSSFFKRKKRTKRFNVNRSDDLITNLPNSLIAKILSSLPTKDAVATSVLSTKWKQSWMSITNLDFDDELTSDSYNVDRDTPKFRKFTEFVNRVLLLRERSRLQKVRLKCYRHSDDSLFNAWLTAILQCNVQELDISVSVHEDHPGLLLPSELIVCSTLVVLKLDAMGYLNIPRSACLPCLKTLHLSEVEFDDDGQFTSLLSGCPVLEELKISECLGVEVHVVNITSRNLKRLIVERLPHDEEEEYQIVIDTPALEYLDLSANFAIIYVLKKMEHLIKAEIKFSYYYLESLPVDWDFFDGISHLQNLVLSGGSVETIYGRGPDLPTFSKLTYLKINTGCGSGWRVLAELLQKSPCLKTLYIQKIDDGNYLYYCRGTLSFSYVPSCFRSHLKEVEYDNFEDDEDEMEVVELILKNARVLEKFTLHYKSDHGEVDPDVAKALLYLPRASAVCRVVIL